MCGNMNRRPIGRCSECGGVVSLPEYWMGVNRPLPTCESCGRVANEANYLNLPIIPMKPRKSDVWPREWSTDNEPPYKITRTNDKLTLYDYHKDGFVGLKIGV